MPPIAPAMSTLSLFGKSRTTRSTKFL